MRNRLWMGMVVLSALVLGAAGCRRARPPLNFSPEELPEARVGEPYQAEITVSGNQTPVFWMLVEEGQLPPGLELKHQDGEDVGVITGTPTEGGEFSFAVTALCYGTNTNGQTGSRTYQLRVMVGEQSDSGQN